MEIGYRASRYNPEFEGVDCVTAEEAIAYAQEGTGGTVSRQIDGRTVSAWVYEGGCWYQINVLSGAGERLQKQRPN